MSTFIHHPPIQHHQPIQHHHLLGRIETQKCPQKRDKRHMERKLELLVKEIGMKKLGNARMFYVGKDKAKSLSEIGMTGILPIQTSHIAFHFWNHPAKTMLNSTKSKCLVQFDLYTCGKLTKKEIKEILHIFDEYEPTHASITLINRKHTMKIEASDNWDIGSPVDWNTYISKYSIVNRLRRQ